MPTFCGLKDIFNDFEHLLLNHFRPFVNTITENKISFIQSLLREEAIEYGPSRKLTDNADGSPCVIPEGIRQRGLIQ